jgi:hypothetical protein
MELVRARVVQNDSPECVYALLAESKIFFPEGLPLEGEIVNVPQYWLDRQCPHGRLGVKFRLEVTDSDTPREPERAKSGEVEFEATDSRIDATKNIGYPAREHGPIGSHPMHDDFDDESGPDGSGTY